MKLSFPKIPEIPKIKLPKIKIKFLRNDVVNPNALMEKYQDFLANFTAICSDRKNVYRGGDK